MNPESLSGSSNERASLPRQSERKTPLSMAKMAGLYLLGGLTAGLPGILLVTQRKKLATLYHTGKANLAPFAVGNVKSNVKSNHSSTNFNSPEEIISKLCDKYSIATVIQALNYLEQNDVRFKGENDLFHIDLISLKKSIDAKAEGMSPEGEMPDASTIKKIGDQLVGIVARKPVKIGINHGNHQLIQEAGHTETNTAGVISVISETTISSEIIKKVNTSAVANLSSISLVDEKNQPHSVLLTRSGRSDNMKRVMDKSAFDIAARLKTETKAGLTLAGTDSDPYYIYQRADVSLMDNSWIKAIGMIISGLIKGGPIEDERVYLKNKKNAFDLLWDGLDVIKDTGGRSYLEHKINHEGKIITVREYRPLSLRFVFSECAKSKSNLKEARLANQASILEMAYVFAHNINNEDLKQAIKVYQKEPSKLNKLRLITALNEAHNELKGDPNRENRIILQGIKATLTGDSGKFLKHKFDTSEGSAQLFLYTYLLAKKVGLPFTVECKSGKDRTAVAAALMCAMDEFKLLNGYAYDPLTAPNSGDFEQFANLFAEKVSSFGKATSLASQGAASHKDPRPMLKVKKSPVFRHFALQRGYWRKRVDLDVKLT